VVIPIEADNPVIGLTAFVPVGMSGDPHHPLIRVRSKLASAASG